MRVLKASIASIALLMASLTSLANATVIDTTAGVNLSVAPFGAPNTATYGQTFTVGVDNILNNFSLFLNSSVGSDLNLRGYIGAWDGGKATNILYSSDTRTMIGINGREEFAFNTGNLALSSGSQYVAFLSVSELPPQPGETHSMPYGSDTLYDGGSFVFFNNGNNFSLLTSQNWDCSGCFGDAAFRATLSSASAAVPEPATTALLSLGLLGFAASRRKSTKNKAA